MLLAVLTDIHANRQAFTACLEAARAQGAERLILLGDFVGYGGDPEWTVDTVMGLVGQGAIAVCGNHDHAIGVPSDNMNAAAQAAIDWTRERLGPAHRKFLASLPLTHEEDDRLYVHSEASSPRRWRYVQSADDATRSMLATPAQITFCGHIHLPALYSLSADEISGCVPTTGISVPLREGWQWLAVAGAVGQPRDGNPAACFLTFDTRSREVTYCRVAYDVEAAAKRIRDAGLPRWLADRLSQGR